MHLSPIARHLGLSLLLVSPLAAQERPRAVDAGNYLYISGQGARRVDGTVPSEPDAQFRQALDNVKAALESAGLTLENVVYAQVYLTDIGSCSEMNRVFAQYFPKTPPARAVLGVKALPDPPVQINAVAVRNLDGRKAIRPPHFPGDESASPGILTHDRLFISGVAGIDPVTGKAPEDPAAQVDLALDQMQAVVEAAGLGLGHVVFVNPYLTSGIPTRVMNERYARRFEFGNTPARATIQVSSLPGGAHIEYTGVAVRDLQQRKAVRPKNMPPSPTASPCVFAGDTLYCSAKSGFIPGPHGGVYAATTQHQLRQTMRNLLDNLEEAGMELSQVVATNVYLDDLGDAPAFNGVYGQYFGPIMPANTTVQQIAPTERKPDQDGHYPDLEQVSLIALRGKPNPFLLSPEERARLEQLSREDHVDMMKQLGITKLRSGPSGNPSDANAANYDPAKANPYPDWPDALTLRDGRKVTSAEMWWQKRRPEIALDFEREIYGRVPDGVPKVTWTVAETVETTVGGQPVVARRVIGHVDNSAHPVITVDVKMAVVLPVNAKGPVPVLMMFGWGNMPDEPVFRFPGAQDPSAPPSTEQLIAAGWGYVSLNTTSIQADNGAGLTAGVIGLANKGKRRMPEQWGSLRAWAWGAARALDYLETLPGVDAKRVGIEGVSRYGKAALVTMAFEPRFAVVLVGSSGEGGTKPHRRNFGEAVENLTGSGEYHWMAGTFLKYGAADASFGAKTAGDIPVDAHELIALCAPRPTFISYGIPEKGDANWLDQQGSYMATVAAGPVFRLLGARDIGVTEDYRVAKMPPHDTSLLHGELAWRQHDGGHEDRSNMSFFIGWANRLLHHVPPTVPADQPRMRADHNSHLAHQQLLTKAKSGGIDVYFLGDSITRRWGAVDYPDFLAHWNTTFRGWNAGNFGWGGDRTENILWRLENGELDGVDPKVIVILGGTNNVGHEPGDLSKVADVTRGLSAIVAACRRKAPSATIVLTAIFPRNDNPAVMPTIERINGNLAKMADGTTVRFLDVNAGLADAKGILFKGMMADGLHPSLKGYDVWAAGLKPILAELLGPPAATDHAPPPTGDPSAIPVRNSP